MIKVKKIILKHNLQYLFLAIGLYIVKALLYFGVAKIPVTIHHFHMKIDELIPFNKYFYVFYFSYYILQTTLNNHPYPIPPYPKRISLYICLL